MQKINSLSIYKARTNPSSSMLSAQNKKAENTMDDSLKGFLLNTRIKKNQNNNDFSDFDEISSRLLIPENFISNNIQKNRNKTELFDMKKAMKPLALAAGFTVTSVLALSTGLKNYSKVMAKEASVVRPPDLARNINILEEPHFAFYQALRDPSAGKVLGFIGVGIMSILTIGVKNFAEGLKQVWIKKQNCDIEHDLQENLISVETEVFSGKLTVVNTLLKDTTKYFKEVLGDKKEKNTNFKSFLSFKGENGKETEENKENKNILTKNNIIFLAGSVISMVGLGLLLYRNASKTYANLKDFMNKFSDKEIRSKIDKVVTESADSTEGVKEKAIKTIVDILKTTNAPENLMKEDLEKINGITEGEIAQAINEVKKAQIYAKAPEALGGVSAKIQYYCYINEERGHLYNWILNPENKFNKYVFLGFCAISASGYVLRMTADAIKDVTVARQNAKSELNLRKNLISTEIENFKAKKLSAINPLIDNFNCQLEKGKSKQELKELAENILSEIKNGPPYVYS